MLLLGALGCGPADDVEADRSRSTRGLPDSTAAGPSPTPPGGGDSSGPEERSPVRVVFLGTSLTAGMGLPWDSTGYVERIERMADSAGLPVEAVNAGVSGETSAGGLRRLDWILERPLDVLVVELGANDGLRGQDPAALEANLREIVRRTRRRRPEVRVILSGMEAPPNMGPGYTRDFREVFPRVADEFDLPLIPFLLEDVAGVDTLNQDDGIHPTAEGHRVIARTVWRVLEPVVRARASERLGEGGSNPVPESLR